MPDAATQPLADPLAEVIAAELAPLAHRIDHEGLYPAAAMRALGGAGLFSHHLAATAARPSLAAAIHAMALVAQTCMSTAFCTWCQDACGSYLEQSENTELRNALQPGLATGATMGGTGLSNPMKSFSGIEPLKLRGRRIQGGYEVSGALPWVSNLGDGHLFGTVFADADDPARRTMGMFRCGQGGVELRQNAHFVALEGTGTYSVLFRRAFLPDAQILADPLGGMVARIKAGFILLQTGMGLGVTAAAIALMREADHTQGRNNAFLPKRADDFAADLAALTADITRLAASPLEQAPEHLRAVLQARLRCSELTLESGQAALLHWGARGYLQGSAVNRRIREGHFVALITPSVRHLRQELQRTELRMAVNSMPVILVRSADGEAALHGAAGETIMRVIQKTGRPGFGECEGSLACATCHVIVDPAWASRLPAPGDDEEAMLDTAFDLKPTSRLSCQIKLSDALDGITVSLP